MRYIWSFVRNLPCGYSKVISRSSCYKPCTMPPHGAHDNRNWCHTKETLSQQTKSVSYYTNFDVYKMKCHDLLAGILPHCLERLSNDYLSSSNAARSFVPVFSDAFNIRKSLRIILSITHRGKPVGRKGRVLAYLRSRCKILLRVKSGGGLFGCPRELKFGLLLWHHEKCYSSDGSES